MRSSTLNTRSGRDVVPLTSHTTSGALDPAYGMEDSSIALESGNNILNIGAQAIGDTISTVAAFGAKTTGI